MPEPLLVVDVQRGFINEYTRHVPGRIRRLIETGAYAPVLYTPFVNTEGSPYQTLLDWHGCAGPPETELVDELAPLAEDGNLYPKHGLAGMPETLAGRVRDERFGQIWVVGLDTDMCVLKIAMDLFDLGIDPRCVLTTQDSMNPVVMEGVAELLSRREDLERFLSIMNDKYGTAYGPEMVDPATNCTFRLRPTWAFGLRADEFTGSPTRWRFRE